MKLGIAKGKVLPPSDVTVLRRAVRASSLWPEGDIEVGSDTSRYFVPLDMVAGEVVGAGLRCIGVLCVLLLLWCIESWWAVELKLRRES